MHYTAISSFTRKIKWTIIEQFRNMQFFFKLFIYFFVFSFFNLIFSIFFVLLTIFFLCSLLCNPLMLFLHKLSIMSLFAFSARTLWGETWSSGAELVFYSRPAERQSVRGEEEFDWCFDETFIDRLTSVRVKTKLARKCLILFFIIIIFVSEKKPAELSQIS